MKGRKTWQLGYAAGIIDSDGCITIGAHKPSNRKTFVEYRLEVIVNQTDGRVVDFLYGTFGGHLCKRNSKPNDNYRPFLYRWELRTNKAATFLKRILPMLRIKKEQAELGIRFQSIKNTKRGRFTRDNPRNRLKYQTLHQKMKILKKIYLPSAAAETKWNDTQKSEAIVQAPENLN